MKKKLKRQVRIFTTPNYNDNTNAPYKWKILREDIVHRAWQVEDYGWSETPEIAFKDAEYTLKILEEK